MGDGAVDFDGCSAVAVKKEEIKAEFRLRLRSG
jgi:hypothetical protein